MFTVFLIHLQNFIVNQIIIHFITFGGGYVWEGRLQVDRPITWGGGGGVSKHSKYQLMIPDTSNFLFVTVNQNS